MNSVIIAKPFAFWAILSLGILVFYFSLILWFPFPSVWGKLEQIDYSELKPEEFRNKVRGSLSTVSTLLAFSIVFVMLSLTVIFTSAEPFSQPEWNVLIIVVLFFTLGAIFLIVALEAYDTCLNPAFDSGQISAIYTRGWWFYTVGIYLLVIALLLAIYLLEPWLTITGVVFLIGLFTFYLKTPL